MAEFDTIGTTADGCGVPRRIGDELKLIDDTDFDSGGGPSYDVTGNDINLPADIYDRLQNGTLRDTDLPSIYNEMWHAYFDQAIESGDKCSWVLEVIRQETAILYGGDEDLADEAMSETIDQVIWRLLTARRGGRVPDLSHGACAQPPLHDDKGERFAGNPLAKVKLSVILYDLTLHVLYFDCDLPAGAAADAELPAKIRAMQARVAEIPGRATSAGGGTPGQ
jgi:hypothetical protein